MGLADGGIAVGFSTSGNHLFVLRGVLRIIDDRRGEGIAPIRIGTAGWSIPKPQAAAFPGEGTHLQRYARRFSAVEINSSFYRPHRPATYARWAAGVPADFRFAVKLPREITHRRKLISTTDPLERFLAETQALGGTLGPLLVQLPPTLRFDESVAEAFFESVRDRFDGDVVCEPRHATWFADDANALLVQSRIARVAADPAVVPRAAEPGGWPGLIYRRLHGSPRIYYSDYPAAFLDRVAGLMRPEDWCIFDNTALGEATGDALELLRRVRPAD
jgi:uncharacterized protein YecE (DUF72 family)